MGLVPAQYSHQHAPQKYWKPSQETQLIRKAAGGAVLPLPEEDRDGCVCRKKGCPGCGKCDSRCGIGGVHGILVCQTWLRSGTRDGSTQAGAYVPLSSPQCVSSYTAGPRMLPPPLTTPTTAALQPLYRTVVPPSAQAITQTPPLGRGKPQEGKTYLASEPAGCLSLDVPRRESFAKELPG